MDNFDDPDCDIKIEIDSGHTLKQISGIAENQGSQTFIIFFYPDKINIIFFEGKSSEQMNDTHIINVPVHNFDKYKYDIKEDGQELPQYGMKFLTSNFKKAISSTYKNDGILLMKRRECSDNVLVKIIKTKKGGGNLGSGMSPIQIKYEIMNCIYDIPQHYFIENSCNFILQCKEFSEICSQISSLKCLSASIIYSPDNYVIMNGRNSDNTLSSTVAFIQQSNRNRLLYHYSEKVNLLYKTDNDVRIEFSIKTAKAIAKFIAIAAPNQKSATVSFFIEKSKSNKMKMRLLFTPNFHFGNSPARYVLIIKNA